MAKNASKFEMFNKKLFLRFVVNCITFHPHLNFFISFPDRRSLKFSKVKCNATNKKKLSPKLILHAI